MSDPTSTRTTGAPAALPAMAFEPMIAMTGRIVAAQAATQAHFLSQVKAFHDELYGFVDKRLGEDRSSGRLLAGAFGPDEIVAVWSQFVSTAVGDYAREASRMADLAARAFHQSAADVERQALTVTRLGNGRD